MSRKATDWAWDQLIKPASLKILLLSMADRADEDHLCYPSITRLTQDTSLDKKTVQSGILKLIELGLVQDTGKKRGPTQRVRVLKLNLETFILNEPKNGNIPKNGNNPENGTLNDPENGNIPKNGNNPKNGTLNDPENGTLNDPENGIRNQSLEPVNESLKDYTPPAKNLGLVAGKANPKSTRVTLPSAGLDFSSWPALPSEQVFADWVAIRKLKKSPLTQTAVNCLAKPLAAAVAAGYAVDDIFALCATRGWIAFKLDWLTNAGLERANGVASDWAHLVFNPEDPLV